MMLRALALFLSVLCLPILSAIAQESGMPPAPAIVAPPAPTLVPPPADLIVPTLDGELSNAAYPMLRLTPDKIEVIRLEADAANVVVGNAKHLVAVVETPRQIMLIPRLPGATHFEVLDAAGKTLMERDVIIAAPKQDYVRVRRACTAGKKDCADMSVFYCPDMCHQVAVTGREDKTDTNPAANAGAMANSLNGNNAGAAGGDDTNPESSE